LSEVRVNHVSMRFASRSGLTLALDDICLEVPEAQFACIVGASGCGKSTLLNIIGGLAVPSAGEVYVGGARVTQPGANLGMVFQSYTLFPWLRVRENIEFGPKLRGIPRTRRRDISDELLRVLGLQEFTRAYPRELSGGMKQRVAIARALANDPAVLLMDEPFGALDALTRSAAQAFLTGVWEQQKRTIVFVTHDIDEAIFLGDVIFVMSRRPGRIREVVRVELPRPRTLEDVASPEFAALKHRVLSLILDEALEAAAQ
jgi:NitT/TauT family transport system ATP-binding protein